MGHAFLTPVFFTIGFVRPEASYSSGMRQIERCNCDSEILECVD